MLQRDKINTVNKILYNNNSLNWLHIRISYHEFSGIKGHIQGCLVSNRGKIIALKDFVDRE